jgi:DNA mismatch repair protein MutS
LKGYTVTLSKDDEAITHKLRDILKTSGYAPPILVELAEEAGANGTDIVPLLHILKDRGETCQVSSKLWYHNEVMNKLQDALKSSFGDSGGFSVGQFKKLTNTSRKHCHPAAGISGQSEVHRPGRRQASFSLMTKANKESSMTPLMKQYYAVKNQHKESLVLFRMGDFFETFDDDAKDVSKILGITLTKRANGAAAQVPLAGFPHHALDTYLPKLVAAGKRIAICEQVEDPKLAKGIVKREVVEVVTPGTASPDDEGHTKNNFLSAVCRSDSTMGLSLLDLSTGEFFLAEGSGDTVRDLFLKFAPSEIIVVEGEEVSKLDWVAKVNPFVTEMDQWTFDHDLSRTALLEHFKVASLKGFGCEEMPAGVTAAGVILRYVTQNIQSAAGHITRLVPLRPENEMGLDNFTVRNLELFTSLATQGTHGTLLSVLDETVTAGGARMLRSRMARPITDQEKIENRLDLVDGFFTEEKLRSDFRRHLATAGDLERILGKLSRGVGTPRDMNGLKQTLNLIPDFQREMKGSKSDALSKLADRFTDVTEVSEKINSILVDSPPANMAKGDYIADSVDDELDELRKIARGGKEWIAAMQLKEREKTGIKSLKVGYNKVFGYFLEVTKTHQDKVPETYIRKQTLVNAERFITPELKEYEEKILGAEEKILEIEAKLFNELRQWVLGHASAIQQNGELMNEIDVSSTLAEVAKLKIMFVRILPGIRC